MFQSDFRRCVADRFRIPHLFRVHAREMILRARGPVKSPAHDLEIPKSKKWRRQWVRKRLRLSCLGVSGKHLTHHCSLQCSMNFKSTSNPSSISNSAHTTPNFNVQRLLSVSIGVCRHLLLFSDHCRLPNIEVEF